MRSAVLAALLVAAPAAAQPKNEYVKRPTRAETVRATLAAFDLPALDGKWYYAGPFENHGGAGFDTAYPPEGRVDLKATYPGKGGATVGWKELPRFRTGAVYDLAALFPTAKRDACVYLYTEFEAKQAVVLPLFLGSDDTVSVWLDRTRLLHENQVRAAAPDQNRVELRMSAGTHRLLVKVCQSGGEWAVYVQPGLPDSLPPQVAKQFARDFPSAAAAGDDPAEARHYAVTTFNPPADCVLEVGGLAFRPDGKLLACTRRGEVWLIDNPADPAKARFTRFAAGLHEPLGMWAEGDRTVYVVQRPELTRMTDRDGDGRADAFATVCDKWGVSGDYHEFAFGPARSPDGHFFVTLNVGFGGGHQAKAPWRGWCVRIDPKTGEMEPWAYGLRSPNGVTVAPDGELFYADNQGEWVATNKLHHLKRGRFYGHQAGLKWVKDSPFAGLVPDRVPSGMRYDGERPDDPWRTKYPDVDPPCVWFPYGRMGQSASEPVWDTTGGKFGPFAGQCFVGDQTRSSVMRVALEKVNGVYQGACFPFRGGLQCGVNRIAFGPDGAMVVGQTNRGWGSVGGKPYGLQRITFSGEVPFEVHTMAVTPAGFDLLFTKPLDPKAVRPESFVLKSFTYVYASQYGYPETDTRPEKVMAATVSADGRRVSLAVPGRRKGRVYDLRLTGVRSAAGDEVLHPEAYYTLNELPK
jgi:hypothetical protein